MHVRDLLDEHLTAEDKARISQAYAHYWDLFCADSDANETHRALYSGYGAREPIPADLTLAGAAEINRQTRHALASYSYDTLRPLVTAALAQPVDLLEFLPA